MSFAATWLELEEAMLVEVSRNEKENTRWLHFYVGYRKINKTTKHVKISKLITELKHTERRTEGGKADWGEG